MKTKTTSIMIHRVEGAHEECIRQTLEGPDLWERANQLLLRWAQTAPQGGGYDKCDFAVTWEDGQEYTGRFDLEHVSHGAPDLARHMLRHLGMRAFSWRPPSWSDEQWAAWKVRRLAEGEHPDRYTAFLDTYEIGAEKPREPTTTVQLPAFSAFGWVVVEGQPSGVVVLR